jgi:hypothetical protein
MLPIAAVAILLACLLDPILWTLALVGVLLGRKMAMPTWGTISAGAALAIGGSLVLLAIVNPDREMTFLGFGARLLASLIAAGLVLWILRVFDKRKTP